MRCEFKVIWRLKKKWEIKSQIEIFEYYEHSSSVIIEEIKREIMFHRK